MDVLPSIVGTFALLAGGTVLAVLLVLSRYLGRGFAAGATVVLILWLAYALTLGWLGILARRDLSPPGIVWLVGPVFIALVLGIGRSRIGGRIAAAVPLSIIIALQSFRIGVELFIHRFWEAGLAPRLLTLAGGNLDLLVGLSAPAMAWIAKRPGARIPVLAWNLLGVVSLANVAARSVLSAPGRLHVLSAEVPNTAFGHFPFGLIPGFFAPLALCLHVLAFRALALRVKRGS